MERNFTVITETENGTIKSLFRFKQKKAETLARHMDNLTGTNDHYPIETDDSDLIAYEPRAFDKDGNLTEECEKWQLYDVVSLVFNRV